MQAQKEEERELIGEVRGKTVTRTIKELSPMGVRLESNDEGQFTGKYTAAHIETVSIFLKTDGTSEWETKAIETTNEGDVVVINGRGTGRNTSPTEISFDGEVVYMTQSPKLSWLNTTKGWVEGAANNATGEFHGRVFAVK
jgi:regulator of RNase E activity RraA